MLPEMSPNPKIREELERPVFIEDIKAEAPVFGRVDNTLRWVSGGCSFQLLEGVFGKGDN